LFAKTLPTQTLELLFYVRVESFTALWVGKIALHGLGDKIRIGRVYDDAGLPVGYVALEAAGIGGDDGDPEVV
jgi:hypothetical protein